MMSSARRAIVVVALLASCGAHGTTEAEVEGWPRADKVMAEISGPTDFDTAARQASALQLLSRVLREHIARQRTAGVAPSPAQRALLDEYQRGVRPAEALVANAFDKQCWSADCPKTRLNDLRYDLEQSDAFKKFLWERLAAPAWRARNVKDWQALAQASGAVPTLAALPSRAERALAVGRSTRTSNAPLALPDPSPGVVLPTDILCCGLMRYRLRLGESRRDAVRSMLVGRVRDWSDGAAPPRPPGASTLEWRGAGSDEDGSSMSSIQLTFDENQTLIALRVVLGTGDRPSQRLIFQRRQGGIEKRYTSVGAPPRSIGMGDVTPQAFEFGAPGVVGSLVPTPNGQLIETYISSAAALKLGLLPSGSPLAAAERPTTNPLLGQWRLAGGGLLCGTMDGIRFDATSVWRRGDEPVVVRYFPDGKVWRVDPMSANDFFRHSFEILEAGRIRAVELGCELVLSR